ncbi:hypothetical protein PIIN_03498 [Serendipita indica DSM 11827]|uniref:Mediator of RNA polymerase II transcription subunit 1 n=1 Tax=Serendipita indica (strain DSM 11827) TaxID=1109443 RepID=G4TE16_SERID|nr:hypothetical protein PIIN_03498 [Serendipita indica DSM 11827]
MQAENGQSKSFDASVTVSGTLSKLLPLPHVTDGRNLHPLANPTLGAAGYSESPASAVRKLLSTFRDVSHSLTAATSYPILDQRTVTLYKEHSLHEQSIHKAARTAKATLKALRGAREASESQYSAFGLPIPTLRSQVCAFVLNSIERWANAAKLEYFLDESHATDGPVPFPSTPGRAQTPAPPPSKKITASLTKEHLLVDFEFEKDGLADSPQIDLPIHQHVVPLTLRTVKITVGDKDDTSFGSSGHAGGTLHGMLEEKMNAFLFELACGGKRTWAMVDNRRVEKVALELQAAFRGLDQMADIIKHETEAGAEVAMSWWDCVPILTEKVLSVIRIEQKCMSSEWKSHMTEYSSTVPLDILAMRSCGIPLPYLNSISLSILPHLSPLAYLTLLRSWQASKEPRTEETSDLADIPLSHLRAILSDRQTRRMLDVPEVDISYDPSLPSSSVIEDMLGLPLIANPPSMPFALDEESRVKRAELTSFVLMKPSFTGSSELSSKGGWTMSCRIAGGSSSVILSQARMKRVAEAIGKSHTSSDALNLLSLTAPTVAVGPSWLDLTIDPSLTQASRTYTSRYQPPPGDDPGLFNVLMPLTEPGLAFHDLPVRTLDQVLSVISILKEQLWLRSLLVGVGFQAGYRADDLGPSLDKAEQGMEDAVGLLESLLSDKYTPTKLRVTYEVIADGRTGVRVTFPFKQQTVVSEVALDLACSRGVSVHVNGERIESLEEVVRRGGLLGLVTAVWRRTQIQ